MRIQAVSVAIAVVMAVASGSAHAQGAFYQATTAELVGAPGSIIRQEAFDGAPDGASAYRVLYRSTGLGGEPIAVSGVVIVPAGAAPTGGRPVVAWAHPTSGIEPRCAPSLSLLFYAELEGLRDMLSRGYVVTATDYPGLGTSGPHPYLVGISEGRAVLDSVRAARRVAGAGDQFALWGHSQGGQAVLYAADLARRYAPELRLAGVAAAAPATDLLKLIEDDIASSGGKNLLAMALWSWSRVFGAPLDPVVQADAIPLVNRLAATCESLIDILPRDIIGDDLQRGFLKVTAAALGAQEPWKGLLASNTIGALPPDVPVFIAQGTADETVDPPVTSGYVARLCAAGSRVQALAMKGVGHLLIARDAAPTAIGWMADRFAGRPAPSDCG